MEILDSRFETVGSKPENHLYNAHDPKNQGENQYIGSNISMDGLQKRGGRQYQEVPQMN